MGQKGLGDTAYLAATLETILIRYGQYVESSCFEKSNTLLYDYYLKASTAFSNSNMPNYLMCTFDYRILGSQYKTSTFNVYVRLFYIGTDAMRLSTLQIRWACASSPARPVLRSRLQSSSPNHGLESRSFSPLSCTSVASDF